jgi:hypothetical protein
MEYNPANNNHKREINDDVSDSNDLFNNETFLQKSEGKYIIKDF